MNRLPLLALLALLSACATRPPAPLATPAQDAPAPDAASPAEDAPAMVAEAWVSPDYLADQLDSPAVWPTEEGGAWVVVTAKKTHQLLVFDADTGRLLRRVGGPGQGPGQFDRPNGIAIYGDLAFVTERDNHRVQVLELPGFTPRGFIGTDVLTAPYGLWVRETAPDRLELLVTDSYMASLHPLVPPPLEQLGQRVKRFEVDVPEHGDVQARLRGAFGDTSPGGALHMVESIAGDPAHDRLLIADEYRQGQASTLRDYTLEGRWRGDSLPPFRADAEGIALWDCDAEDGYWIAVDQVAPTVFRVYDRATLAPRGSFTGAAVANTDGEALYAAGTPRFPHGALFVQSDDRAVAAFDLRQIARALHLAPACTR